MSSLEFDERLRFGERWGATLYVGVATCSVMPGRNTYASAAAGLYYVLKPVEKMVTTLEYADGEGENRSVYLRFGCGFRAPNNPGALVFVVFHW